MRWASMAIFRDFKEPTARYSLAVLVAVIAVGLRGLLQPLLGTANPYHTIWAAVVFAAWCCGVGPAIVSMIIGLLGVWFWFVSPVHSFGIPSPADQFGILAYVVLCGFVIALGESNRRTSMRRD